MMFFRFFRITLIIFSVVSSHLYAGRGAGVLPIFEDNTILIDSEYRASPKPKAPIKVWSDFGGGEEKEDKTIIHTAYREFQQETAYMFPRVSLSEVSESLSIESPSYCMFLVRIPGEKPLIEEIRANKLKAVRTLGARKAAVEKEDWKYVTIEEFNTLVFESANIPGTNEYLYHPMVKLLQNSKIQEILEGFKTKLPASKSTALRDPLWTLAFDSLAAQKSQMSFSEYLKEAQLSEKEEKKHFLLEHLNADFHLEREATLPKNWQLVSSSSSHDNSAHVSLKKNNVGIKILGDNYTLYNNLPSLKDFDTITFLFSVELRGTRAGAYIQYWDGVNFVNSTAYNGKRKGKWETLSVEFTVDAKEARFYRLYAAILGPTKGATPSLIDIKNVKLQQK